jgi:hypothetical protein
MPPRKKKPTKMTPAKAKSKDSLHCPYTEEFEHLKKEIKKAYHKLEKDLHGKADPKTLQEDNNRLFLLLGECHYFARECWNKLHPKRK